MPQHWPPADIGAGLQYAGDPVNTYPIRETLRFDGATVADELWQTLVTISPTTQAIEEKIGAEAPWEMIELNDPDVEPVEGANQPQTKTDASGLVFAQGRIKTNQPGTILVGMLPMSAWPAAPIVVPLADEANVITAARINEFGELAVVTTGADLHLEALQYPAGISANARYHDNNSGQSALVLDTRKQVGMFTFTGPVPLIWQNEMQTPLTLHSVMFDWFDANESSSMPFGETNPGLIADDYSSRYRFENRVTHAVFTGTLGDLNPLTDYFEFTGATPEPPLNQTGELGELVADCQARVTFHW